MTKGMDSRPQQLLRLIIDDYIKTAEPVGSKYLVEQYKLDISPATVRNEMSLLEEEGYLRHAHTSSGRIPTEKAYLYYLKELLGNGGKGGDGGKEFGKMAYEENKESAVKSIAKRLVEVSGETDGPCCAVIGLGLNLFVPETDAQGINQAWTDLTKITGQHRLFRNKLAGTLLNHLLPVIADYEGVGIKAHLDEWRSYDCLSGQAATLFIGQQQFEGQVRGIDDNGMLLIERPDGTVQTFASGEVSFNAGRS